MMPLLFFLILLCINPKKIAYGQDDPKIDPVESDAVFDVLYSINYEIDWRGMYPGNPCTGGPHGVNCDLDPNNVWHVTELNLGWVSDYVNNPPCSYNASIHPSVLKFSHLKKLFFYKCFMHKQVYIPPQLAYLSPSLKHLTFQGNVALIGKIPPELGNLTHLERLVLTENKIVGEIPVELGNLRSLRQLVLSHNGLYGTIPTSIGSLKRLLILDLSGNMFAGSIPAVLYGLPELQKLDLSFNVLQGSISDELGGLKTLKFLDLSHNNITGQIPQGLSSLTEMQSLFLGNNPLGGQLPDIFGGLKSLMIVGLSQSGYRGKIPDSLGSLKNLNSLALDNNRLSGNIPPNLGQYGSIYHMNLSSNSLSGPLPFGSAILTRMGRNLIVKNNAGLCYEKGLENAGAGSLGISTCGSSSSTAAASSPFVSNLSSQIAIASSRTAGIAISVIIFCFWHDF